MIGSEGTSKGSLTITRTERASPGTSTPSQKARVPSSTARSVVAEGLQQACAAKRLRLARKPGYPRVARIGAIACEVRLSWS